MLSLLLVFTLCLSNALPANAGRTKVAKTVTTGTCEQDAKTYNIYPIPQSITYTGEEFTLGDVVIVQEEQVDKYTLNFLKEVLDTYHVAYTVGTAVQEGRTNILLGIAGSEGVVDQYADQITVTDTNLYSRNDAYMLDASKNTIVILGKDTDSVFYGVATLQMMFSSFAGQKFLETHIEDYATVATRGYIEGFYGAWNFTERQDLMKFARDYKINSYVYAAKNDNYHTSKWADLYPDATLEEFKKLVQVGEETKVKFAWSIHLGSFFGTFSSTSDTNFTTQFNKLKAKLDQLIGIGIKRIDVLNDDFGSGSHATVVEVLNMINAYLKEQGCEPLTYCPQGYNTAWSGNGAELEALKSLDSDINIYWTGDDVNAPITQSTIDHVTEKSGHTPDFWLNYPVNEHAKSGVFLGDITYYARDNVTGLAGFHSNPSRYAYANEVGLYQLAALVWNNNNYSAHAQEIWESAFDYLQPEVKDSYFKIASNISNAPNSTRVPGFNESEYLKEKIEAVEQAVVAGSSLKDLDEAQFLLQEFQDIQDAIVEFREKCANQNLVDELDPWLNSLNDLAVAGKAVLESLVAMENEDASTGWEKLSVASKAYDSAYTHNLAASDLNGVAKAGTKRLSPFIEKLVNEAKNKLTPILNPSDDQVSPVLYAVIGGTTRSDDANGKKLYDGNVESCAKWDVNQQAGDYFGLDLGRVVPVKDITIVQGTTDADHDIFHKARLEYSTDGTQWTTIADYSDGSEDLHKISVNSLDIRARYVRLYLVEKGISTKADFWTHVREFTVNQKEEEHDRIYTNVEQWKETPLTIAGANISVRDLNNVALQPNEYIGIKLVSPATVVDFTKEYTGNGLTLEYSYNGTQWLEATVTGNTIAAKYLRLINKTTSAVQADIQNVGMTVKYLDANPEYLSASIDGLTEGSYDSLFDGDLSSYILTKGTQKKDASMTFDLGKTVEIHDVTAVTTDGAERFYNAKIQVSTDNAKWIDVATVENDNSVMEVPYRYVRGNGNGVSARYLRVLFTGNNSNSLKLYEIQINANVEANQETKQVVSNMSGKLEALTDRNIATLFAAQTSQGGYIEYRMTDNTNVDQISVLQGTGSTGKAYAITDAGKVLLGTLDKSVAVFDTTGQNEVYAVRLEWDVEESISVHEISISYGANSSDDKGVYVDPIIVSGGERPFTNIAALAAVTVSGTSDGNKDNVNDGDLSTKWDSNAIKNGTTDTDDAWLCLDFGSEKTYEFNKIVVNYFNKIYPTSWLIQVSDDGVEWTDVTDTLTKENNGATHPVETVEFETAVTGRYVRLYFNTLNTAAAGNGVGVKEVEVYGRERLEVEEETISEQQNIALNKTVTVSGTSNGVKESINDGNTSTKWDSDFIKGANANKEAWAVIDLGTETTLMDSVKVSFFNKVYPTQYQIQVSNDSQKWTTVETLSKEHNGPTHPTDEVEFTTPVSARYVRFLFTELNSAAAGNGVGINEVEILGRYVYTDVFVKEVETVENIEMDKGQTFDATVLPTLMNIKVEGKALKDTLTVLVPVTWDTSVVDPSVENTYTVEGTLSLHGINNDGQFSGTVQVVVNETAPVLDYTNLDQALENAKAKEADKDSYTEESYAVFKTAYEEAKTVKAEATTQDEIDAAVTKLTNAINGLVEKPVEPEQPDQPDKPETPAQPTEEEKTEAKEYLDACKDYYTEDMFQSEEEWVAYLEALKALEEALANGEITSEELQEAVNMVDQAVQNVTTDTDPEEPSKPSQPSEDEDQTNDKDNVQTGDMTMISVWMMLAVVSLIVLVERKRRIK